MTMDVQTVFIGALMLCKPGIVDEIIPDLELDLFRPELRDALRLFRAIGRLGVR